MAITSSHNTLTYSRTSTGSWLLWLNEEYWIGSIRPLKHPEEKTGHRWALLTEILMRTFPTAIDAFHYMRELAAAEIDGQLSWDCGTEQLTQHQADAYDAGLTD